MFDPFTKALIIIFIIGVFIGFGFFKLLEKRFRKDKDTLEKIWAKIERKIKVED